MQKLSAVSGVVLSVNNALCSFQQRSGNHITYVHLRALVSLYEASDQDNIFTKGIFNHIALNTLSAFIPFRFSNDVLDSLLAFGHISQVSKHTFRVEASGIRLSLEFDAYMQEYYDWPNGRGWLLLRPAKREKKPRKK